MISLIVNADDLGCGPERDQGILDAFRNGIVTSASLLANGPSFETAVALIKESGLPIGVHLNLAEGQPLTGAIPGLTGPAGEFPGKFGLRARLADIGCDQTALHSELAAQIERVLATGLRPDHLDSHQHCQLFPCVAEVLADLTRTYGIFALRNASPAEPAEEDPEGALGNELALYRALNRSLPRPPAGLRRPDGLWGMPLLDRLDTAGLCTLLEQLPDGVWELMAHPGYPTPGNPFDGAERLAELRALTSPQARAVVVRRGIHLCHFGVLQCAS